MDPTGPSLKEIFNQALDHPAGTERSSYLDRACAGDDALRLQVESLLKAHDEAGRFLGSADPGATASLSKPSILEGPGSTIGPYKLLQQIGEGGMGVVFMAEQEKPVRRKVALKVIKPGMDTAQVIARFEAERQALAMMDHPNIARVLDVGATETGRPFFVMELVKGVPITEYCDRNHLSPKERLELFIPVCKAIQSAHQKGIIHRDIKPSNVLVTLHDGQAIPKVIDFGVAKAIDQRLTERTMFTEFGAIIGTLEYMSPEQAEMGALDVDTRSDIYSLGVMLYELLTGSTPLERAKLKKAAYSEVLRRIREEEPTKPSTRLSESKDALPSISAQRKMEPARLTKLVRGDLDWIVMKSLEKDRTRRYETATGFARDIQRYLDGDAVEACPPSASYKLKKFARKHRKALATAGAFALLLVAATAVSLGLAYWATRERDRALAAEKSAEEQESLAHKREHMAIDAVKRFGEVISETPELKDNPTLAPLRTKLLKEPQAFFKKLRERLQAEGEMTTEFLYLLADASFDLGHLAEEIGDQQDALRAYEESLSFWERLVREVPSDTDLQKNLAMSHNNIGNLQSETGLLAEAWASHKRALAIRERLAHENTSATEFLVDLAASHNNMGNLLRKTGRSAEALASHEQALKIRERLARENPSAVEFQNDLATSHNNIGAVQSEMGRSAEALASLGRALVIRERLIRENPSVTDLQEVAAIHHNIGFLQSDAGRQVEALASYERALVIRQRLARDSPSITKFQDDLATSYNNIGDLLRETGRSAEALASLEKALAIRERLTREHPESPDFAHGLGGTLHNIASIDLGEGRFEEARKKLKRAIEWQRKALSAYPNHPEYLRFLTNNLKSLFLAAVWLGRADEAEEARRELSELAAGDPIELSHEARLAAVLRGDAPTDEVERAHLGLHAYMKSLHVSSVRLYAEALANDPKLAEDREAEHRYVAASAAALAGCGQGKDDPPPDDAARARLRRQALDWLKAELAEWAKVLEAGPAEIKAKVAPALQHWKVDTDLLGIRDEKELAKLPEAERAAFQQLWLDVDRLLARASGKM